MTGTAAAPRREWPAWQVSARARGEWARLKAALAELEEGPACAVAPERWWSKDPGDVDAARLECSRCPAQLACASYARAAGEKAGVWGGVDVDARPRLRAT